jgi:hypothetical protein
MGRDLGMNGEAACGTCRANRGELPSPGGYVFDDGLCRVEHVIEPLPMLGWLVAVGGENAGSALPRC